VYGKVSINIITITIITITNTITITTTTTTTIDFSKTIAEGAVLGRRQMDGKGGRWAPHNDPVTRIFDPTTSNFERQDSVGKFFLFFIIM